MDVPLTIDFGTTYSYISIIDNQCKVHLIPDAYGKVIHRSTIEFMKNGGYKIGTNGIDVIRNIKRLIGECDYININGQSLSVVILVAMIIKSMVRDAEEYSASKFKQCTMAIPVDFSLIQKKILVESARIAGIKVVRFTPESSAEAHLIQPTESIDKYFAIIDLGGGTLDISFVESSEGINEIVYTGGDSSFGSKDFDDKLKSVLLAKLSNEQDISSFQNNEIELLAEQIKIQFNCSDVVTVFFHHSGLDGNIVEVPITVSKSEFELAVQHLVEIFKYQLDVLYSVFEGWTLDDKIPVIYLTGQGTKLYILKNLIRNRFPKNLIVDIYQENALIQGLSGYTVRAWISKEGSLLLNAFPSEIIVKYSNDSENGIILSSKNNGKDYELLGSDCYIPTKKLVVLEFESVEIPVDGFLLEIDEKTTSGKRRRLICERVYPKLDEEYELEIDIDAAMNIDISIICISDSSKSEDIEHGKSILRKFSF